MEGEEGEEGEGEEIPKGTEVPEVSPPYLPTTSIFLF